MQYNYAHVVDILFRHFAEDHNFVQVGEFKFLFNTSKDHVHRTSICSKVIANVNGQADETI